ncbi:hypothetical protein EDC01DRAFT_654738 [Geopyxis carbonaria]|nr:hypothetical protein EDC01DRAFT_654738 [Geopyxis carbonaria]
MHARVSAGLSKQSTYMLLFYTTHAPDLCFMYMAAVRLFALQLSGMGPAVIHTIMVWCAIYVSVHSPREPSAASRLRNGCVTLHEEG